MIMADTRLRHPMIPVDIYIKSGTGDQAEKDEFHVEVWNNRFWAGSLTGAAAANAIGLYLPDRDNITARIDSTVNIRGAKPIKFVDYLYSNEGAGGIVGGVRGLRAVVPLLLNPWAPVAIDSVEVKVDLRYDTNYGDIAEIRVPDGVLQPGKTHMIEVVLDTYGGKQVVDKIPIEVPTSLAGQVVQLEVVPGDSARLDAAPPVDVDTLIAAIRQLLPGDVYAATLYAADEGVALDVRGNRVEIPYRLIQKANVEYQF